MDKNPSSPCILITAGATREPIDGVRFISNMSSGRTGAQIADHFIRAGYEVTYLGGEGAVQPEGKCRRRTYGSFQVLDEILRDELSHRDYQGVIHLSAVSDYSVESIQADGELLEPNQDRKLSSDPESLILRLKRNPKLIAQLKGYAANSDMGLIAFKLTQNASSEMRNQAVEKVFSSADPGWVVQNDLMELSSGQPRYRIYERGQKEPKEILTSVQELAESLERIIRGLK